MGIFYTNCEISSHADRERSVVVDKVLVDTGAEHTWISEKTLREIGIEPEKEEILFVMADGRTISRKIGFAIVRVGDRFTTDEVVFAGEGDLEILGARSLEGLNLTVDPRNKKLIAAGPHLAAAAA